MHRPADRDWPEWVALLKRLATKRRVPARVLYRGQIRRFVGVLECSLELGRGASCTARARDRSATPSPSPLPASGPAATPPTSSPPPRHDRNVLQLLSAGLQVAQMLKDAPAMRALDALYVSTERVIWERRAAGV